MFFHSSSFFFSSVFLFPSFPFSSSPAPSSSSSFLPSFLPSFLLSFFPSFLLLVVLDSVAILAVVVVIVVLCCCCCCCCCCCIFPEILPVCPYPPLFCVSSWGIAKELQPRFCGIGFSVLQIESWIPWDHIPACQDARLGQATHNSRLVIFVAMDDLQSLRKISEN